jgi:hypothetical protein
LIEAHIANADWLAAFPYDFRSADLNAANQANIDMLMRDLGGGIGCSN